MTMGDMKTPDFDDLLAAFDIPDMVDPKAAIESGHDDHESHIKQNDPVDDDSHTPSSSDVGVSVIVKNVHNIDSSEGAEKDSHNPTDNGLYNGFLTASSLDSYVKDGANSSKGNTPASEVTFKDPAFNQISTIASAEAFEDDEKIEVDDPPGKRFGPDTDPMCSRVQLPSRLRQTQGTWRGKQKQDRSLYIRPPG